MTKMNTAVIGCGLIGKRRAVIASTHPRTKLKAVADISKDTACDLAQSLACDFSVDWEEIIRSGDIEIVVVSTPNKFLAPIATMAMKQGKHVLIEKPMGCNVQDALALYKVSLETGQSLKIGFNHRYHPALLKAHDLFLAGEIGQIINIRACYGHGGRPGYEREWRGDPDLSGGGEMTDQGVHLIDLINWFIGCPLEVVSMLQNAVWPIKPLEDNAFGLLRYKNGIVASFHTSWTQWKNLFSFEVFGEKGFLDVKGLGGSYGPERLIIGKRKPHGGVPNITEEIFEEDDFSWEREWDDFISHLENKSAYFGTPEEGLDVMRTIDALYRSSENGRKATLK